MIKYLCLEICELIKSKYFLEHHEERESIALSAHNHFINNYAAPKSLIKLFDAIENKLFNLQKNRLEEPFSPSIFYLQNANKSSFITFKSILKQKKPLRAFSTLFSMVSFRAFIFSLINFPYFIISKIFN